MRHPKIDCLSFATHLLLILKQINKDKDLLLLLAVEGLSLTQERELRANSPEEVNSINAAQLQLQEANNALNVVKDPSAYKAATETYSSKQREAGLPLDAFREFIKSHTTRLSNRLSAPLSVQEKNILRQRKENLRTAKDIYIALQRKALSLSTLETGHAYER
ncbi:hypothetical protein [Desulfovibrio falkowii]|uniref:Uncharacterized protein n=1 Tax=Desulfovibrio falkowii TaxID=3136602 RepID=A0ABQ0E5X8_9BACT